MQSWSLLHLILSRVETESLVANKVESPSARVGMWSSIHLILKENKPCIISLLYFAFVLLIPTFQMEPILYAAI